MQAGPGLATRAPLAIRRVSQRKGMAVALWPQEVDGADLSEAIRCAVTDQNGTYRFAALSPGG